MNERSERWKGGGSRRKKKRPASCAQRGRRRTVKFGGTVSFPFLCTVHARGMEYSQARYTVPNLLLIKKATISFSPESTKVATPR